MAGTGSKREPIPNAGNLNAGFYYKNYLCWKEGLNGFVFQIMGPREWEYQGERKVDILMHVPISTITLSTLPLDFLILFLLSLFSLFSLCVFFFRLPLGLPWPTYFIFTSYSSHGPTGCYLRHVGPLRLLTCFYHSYFFFFPFLLLLGFFYYWAFHKKKGHQQFIKYEIRKLSFKVIYNIMRKHEYYTTK